MKSVLVVFILFFIAQDTSCSQYLKNQADYCIRAYGLDPTKIFKAHANIENAKNNDDYDVFIECYWKRIGFLTRNGDLDYLSIWQTYFELFRKRFDYGESKKRLENLIARCDKITGKTVATRAINMNNCLSETV